MTPSGASVTDGARSASRLTQLEAAIATWPDRLTEAITANFDPIRDAAALVARARRVRLCGVGSGAAVAELGAALLRAVGIDARATNAFDLVVYPANFEPGDLIVGVATTAGRAYTARVIQRSVHAGLKTIAIGDRESLPRGADVRLAVADPEPGLAQPTVFLAAVAALGAIAARFEPRSPLADALPRVPDAARRLLDARETARELAMLAASGSRRIAVSGGGSGFPVAQFGALLLKDIARAPVEAVHVEDTLHGGILHLRGDDLLLQIAPQGPSDDRQADLAVLAQAVGIQRWLIGGAGAPDGAQWHTPLADLPEVIAPLLATIPLGWLAFEIGLTTVHVERDDQHLAALGAIPL